MATASPRRDGQNYVENVIKQGYLKKSVVTNELVTSTTQQLKVNIKQKLEPLRWYVFGVRNRRPYLEYFDKEESVFVGHAIETYDLTMFERLSYTMGTSMPVYSFCIYLSTGNIELTAANRVQMIEWCRTLERHLANLGYKVKRGGDKDDHMYSEFPIKRPPKRTGLEAEMLMEKQALVVELGSGADEEENENDYEDIPDRKVPIQDAKDENDNDKIPCVPERPPKLHKAKDDENVFASLYSVSRNGLESSLEEKEKKEDRELVESHSNETFDDADLFRYFDRTNHQFSVRGKESHSKWTYVDDDENRCTSLPNFPLESEDTSGDTSEDPDFIGASFWLRNRKTEDLILFDVTDPQEAKRKLPPQPSDPPPLVPRRLDSAKRRTVRQCLSMIDSSTTKINEKDRVSPTLELLGQAPKPVPKQRLSRLSPDPQKKNLKESNQSDLNVEHNEFKVKTIKRMDRIVSDDLDDDEIGDYEVAPNKLQVDLTNGNESDQGIYEPAWMCNSRRDPSPQKEKLVVEIPDDSAKSFKKGKDDKSDNSAKENIKPKKKFSLGFSRKDKSFKLPEEISVPASSRHNSADDETDGNLYSDFPGDIVPKRGPSTPDAATSDICKISLENGPSHSTETSPVLPRRQKVKESSRSSEFHDKSLKHSPPPHVQPTPSHNHPPSPPQKSRAKSDDAEHLLIKRDMETPIAPPRRNRKTVHEEILHSTSKGTNKPVINPLSQSTKLYQPKRDLPRVPVDDPPLPPRDEKPALPPPRKGFGSISWNEDYKPDIPERGGRPKSVNITKRQFSTETAALTVMNLKQNQVDILRSEIDSTNGLTRTVTKMQFQAGLALVECFERIWIAGWDLKNFPRLYDKFHVGDQLIAINDVHVSEVSFAEKLVKNIKADTLDVTIKRLPLAKVFALQRVAEGQNLGFKRDGGTAEIIYVDPHGLAARQGLQSRARTIDFACNWWLTEINMRPLNLFFKDNEIEHRLMAVGRDISIVVQPADFVKELRKQLKKMRGYKDYLVQ